VAAVSVGAQRLAGRLALITGASRGIGRAVARTFAREGADLIVVARTQGGLEELDDEIRGLGRHAALVVGDLTAPETIEQMAAAVAARWGRLDILVGNAALLGSLRPVRDIEPAQWERVIALDLTANWRLLRAFDRLLHASDAGRAVFVSAAVAAGRAYWGAYAVAKAGLEALVRTYAHEVARTAVRANLIDPGPCRTALRREAFPGEPDDAVRPVDDPTLQAAFVMLAAPDCSLNGERIAV
jgi:NAD(P)-dependent dehydrogenase (short-subunit alcohol dehydrogenase family)